jgi:hypothetical protein
MLRDPLESRSSMSVLAIKCTQSSVLWKSRIKLCFAPDVKLRERTTPYGLPTGSLRAPYGLPTGSLRAPYGLPTGERALIIWGESNLLNGDLGSPSMRRFPKEARGSCVLKILKKPLGLMKEGLSFLRLAESGCFLK